MSASYQSAPQVQLETRSRGRWYEKGATMNARMPCLEKSTFGSIVRVLPYPADRSISRPVCMVRSRQLWQSPQKLNQLFCTSLHIPANCLAAKWLRRQFPLPIVPNTYDAAIREDCEELVTLRLPVLRLGWCRRISNPQSSR